MGALIDADAIVAIESSGAALLDSLEAKEAIGIAAPTASELLEIVERTVDPALASRRASFVERLLERVEVVAFDGPAARVRAKLAVDPPASRPDSGAPDTRALDLAAIALSRGWSIVTTGSRYDRIPGVRVIRLEVPSDAAAEQLGRVREG